MMITMIVMIKLTKKVLKWLSEPHSKHIGHCCSTEAFSLLQRQKSLRWSTPRLSRAFTSSAGLVFRDPPFTRSKAVNVIHFSFFQLQSRRTQKLLIIIQIHFINTFFFFFGVQFEHLKIKLKLAWQAQLREYQ